MALFKVSAGRRQRAPRSCSSRTSSAGKIIDVSSRSVTVEVTGTDDKIEAFEQHGAPVRPGRDGPHGRDRDRRAAADAQTVSSRPLSGPEPTAGSRTSSSSHVVHGCARQARSTERRAQARSRAGAAAVERSAAPGSGARGGHGRRSRPARPLGGRPARRARRALVLLRAARPRRLRAGRRWAARSPLEARGPGPLREVAVRAREPRHARAGRRRRRTRTARRRGPGLRRAASPSRPTAAPRREWASLAPALAGAAGGLAGPPRRRGAPDRRPLVCRTATSRRTRSSSARSRALERAARRRRMPLLDPDPVERPRVASVAPPAHYEQAVERAVERIGAGELEKIVLAREVRVHAAAPHDPGAVFDALRDAFPACYCFCVGTPELAFVGASPELLVRRDGARAQTVALAGTTRRSADPAVDDHLGEQLLHSAKDREEQAIVARRIERTLEPVSVWVAAADEPVARQGAEHPAPRHADPRPAGRPAAGASSWPGCCIPTPAVGGEPREARRAADSGARGARPRLVRRRRWAGPTSPRTASSASRSAARCCAVGGAPVRGLRNRARLRSRRGAGGDRGQARRRCCRCSRKERPGRVMASQGGVEGRR